MIEDRDTKLFLDFGRNFAKERNFYDEPYLSPREEKHLLTLGILPEIEGIYKKDEREHEINGIAISHAHTDHMDYLRYLKDDIPIYCSDLTKKIILTRECCSKPKSSEYKLASLTKTRGYEEFKKFKSLNYEQKEKISSIELQAFEVDHSILGATSYLVYTSEATIAYTGDFRLHGVRRENTERFIEKARENEVDALIIEGTNVVEAKPSSEEEVRQKSLEVVKKARNIVLVNFSLADIDRLRTFYQVAEESGRELAISMKQAYLLKLLEKEKDFDLNLKDFLIFQREKKQYSAWEDELIKNKNCTIIDSREIGKKQDEIILVASFYDMNEMVELKPEAGSVYILSQSEPFNEEMEIDHRKLLNWLELYGLPLYNIHASGHAYPHEIKKMVEEINPKKVFLIHTERPLLFKRYLEDLDVEVICPKEKEKIKI